jgi:hypothetical protein
MGRPELGGDRIIREGVEGAWEFKEQESLVVGTPNTGVVAVEYTPDGKSFVTRLAVAQVDAITTGDAANLADGYLLYTFPAGEIIVEAAYMSMGLTATAEQAADTPEFGLGTVIGTGAVNVLGGTATFEDIMIGTAAGDAAGTAFVLSLAPTAGAPFVIATAAAHTVHFNVADGWADDTSGDLTADIAGVVTLVWKKLS